MDISEEQPAPALSRSKPLRFTRSSYVLLSAFIALIALIGYVWSPL